jgi:hypothetical protein
MGGGQVEDNAVERYNYCHNKLHCFCRDPRHRFPYEQLKITFCVTNSYSRSF